MHSRHSFPGATFAFSAIVTLRRLHSVVPPLLLGLIVCAGAAQAAAQNVPTVPPAVDSLQTPISPRRAFLYSLVIPGSAQNILGRHRAAVGILGVELTSIAMIRESGADVRQARRQLGDTLVLSYVDENGNRLPTPLLERRRFEQLEISSRRSHVEDWVALLIANHLFAAADAFVAASLWDVSARVTASGNRNRFILMGQIRW